MAEFFVEDFILLFSKQEKSQKNIYYLYICIHVTMNFPAQVFLIRKIIEHGSQKTFCHFLSYFFTHILIL